MTVRKQSRRLTPLKTKQRLLNNQKLSRSKKLNKILRWMQRGQPNLLQRSTSRKQNR